MRECGLFKKDTLKPVLGDGTKPSAGASRVDNEEGIGRSTHKSGINKL